MITTQNGRPVTAEDAIVVAENFPGMAMSQWFVAVRHSAAAYDSPYDPIIWMPKSGYSASSAHDERHAQNKALAELVAAAIRAGVKADNPIIDEAA